ncbi:MAG: WD40 repeat domain-containing protein [Planctomycetota bacterium]|nr:WD40 repeat domain-containing protein [Planctomycetota bacterium]
MTFSSATDLYPTFAAVQEAYLALEENFQAEGATPESLAAIQEFLHRAESTGVLLDNRQERSSCQNLLNYWTTVLIRLDLDAPRRNLADFDLSQAPALSDESCPYVGLSEFRLERANVYFGHRQLIQQILDLLRDRQLVVVTGSSGSGKSSVVLAGVLPRIQAGAIPTSETWVCLPPIVPGKDPNQGRVRVVEWLAKCSTPAVLVVDQFEELFTLCTDLPAREQFVDWLVAMSRPENGGYRVILTVRTDFESYLQKLSALRPLLESSLLRVTPLTTAELREAIEKPAELVGLKFEQGIVEALVGDILGEPAGLPLLQFTLMALWDHRQRNRIPYEAYKRLGGGRVALSRCADQFFEKLLPEEQITAKRVLLQLVQPGEGLEVTRNRVTEESLFRSGEARDRIERVVEKLVAARLVRRTAPETTGVAEIEVVHESLVRNWPRLVDWIEDEREVLRRHKRITQAAHDWNTNGRNSSWLYRGESLATAREWADNHQESLNALEMEFLDASSRRTNTLRRVLVSVLVGGVIATVTLSIFADVQKRIAIKQTAEAIKQTAEAEKQTRHSTAERLANASGKLPEQQAVSRLLLAVEAMRSTLVDKDGKDTRDDKIQPNAARAFQDASRFVTPAGVKTRVLGSHSKAVTSVVSNWDPNKTGRRFLVTGSEDESPSRITGSAVRVWDLSEDALPGRNYLSLSGHGSAVTAVGVSRKDQWLVAGTAEGAVFLREFRSGNPEPVGRLIGRINGSVSDIEFSRTGPWCVVSSREGAIRAWNLESPEQYFDLKGHRSTVSAVVAFELPGTDTQPKSQWVATGGGDGAVLFWNVDSKNSRPRCKLDLVPSWLYVHDLAVTPADDESGSISQLLVGAAQGRIIVCDMEFLTKLTTETDSTSPQIVASFPKESQRAFTFPEGRNSNSSSAISVGFLDNHAFVVAASDGQMYWGGSDKSSNILLEKEKRPIPLNAVDPNMVNDSRSRDFSASFLRVRQNDRDSSSPFRRWVANVREGGAIDLHQVSDAVPVANPLKLRGHDGDINAATFLGQGDGRFVTVGNDGLVRLWDFGAENSLPAVNLGNPFRGGKHVVYPRAHSRNGEWTAAVEPGIKEQWKVLLQCNSKNEPPIVLGCPLPMVDMNTGPGGEDLAPASDSPVTDVHFDIAHNLVFAIDRNRTLRFVATANFRGIYIWPIVNGASGGSVNFYPDKQESQQSAQRRSIDSVLRLVISDGGRWLAAAFLPGRIWIWDLSELKVGSEPVTVAAYEKTVKCLAFSDDERYLASGIDDRTVRIWKLSEVRQLGSSTQKRNDNRGDAFPIVLSGLESSVVSVTLSRDGRRVFAMNQESVAGVWDIADPKQPKQFFDGREMMAITTRLATNSQQQRFFNQQVEMSADGRWLVATETGQQLLLWDLNRHNGPASDSGRSPQFDASDNEPANRMHRPRELGITASGEVNWFKFSPDSRWLVTIHRDGSLATWDLGSISSDDSQVVRPTVRQWGSSGATSIMFNGQDSILTTDRFSTVRRWAMSGSDYPNSWSRLKDLTEPLIGRNLNRQERREFFEEVGMTDHPTFVDLPFEDNSKVASATSGGSDTQRSFDDKNLEVLAILRDLGKRVRKVDENPTSQTLGEIDRQMDKVKKLGFPTIAEDAQGDFRSIYGQTLITKAQESLQAGDLDGGLQGFEHARELVSSEYDWSFLRWIAEDRIRANDFEGAAKLGRLVDQLTPAAPGVPRESTTPDTPETAKRRAAEKTWSVAKSFAAKADFTQAEKSLNEARELGLVLPGKPEEVVRQYFCYQKMRSARMTLQPAESEEDPRFKQVPEIIKQAKQVAAAVPSESVGELVTQMVTRWRVSSLRLRLSWADIALSRIEPPIDKSKVPSLEWFHCDRLSKEMKTAAARGELSKALAKYAEIEESGLTWLVLPNELGELVWMGAVAERATDVADAAELLVKMEPEHFGNRDSRGLVRALNGKIEESISDFEYFVICTPDGEKRERRIKWLGSLRAGEPVSEVFNAKTMQEIKEETRHDKKRNNETSLESPFWKQ